MNFLDRKKILLIICGGIAAYKALDVIRLIKKNGAQVKTILTENAKKFVTHYPLSLFLKEKFIPNFLIMRMKQKWIIYHFLDGLI